MSKEVGLWMDHRKAVIVGITDQGEEMELIASKVEKQLRRSGGYPGKGPYEAQQVPADDSRERKLTGQLNVYYDAIIARIRDAESILIMGPGEAKGELKKRMEREELGGRIVGIETIDRVTDRQIAAIVRERFAIPTGQKDLQIERRQDAHRRGAGDRGRATPRRGGNNRRVETILQGQA